MQAPSGEGLFLKRHRSARKFLQELHAYRVWTPHLVPQVPRLLIAWEGERALLLTAVPGTLAEGLEPPYSEELFFEAGHFLKCLHTLPHHDADPLPVAEALKQRAAAWIERGRGRVVDELLARVQRGVTKAASIVTHLNLSRVPCHRDYTPRNWLVDLAHDEMTFSVIDFEHARADLALLDTVRLETEVWLEHPEFKAAFFGGYGALSEEEEQVLHSLTALEALATLLWGFEHGDEEGVKRGQKGLEVYCNA